MKPHIKLKVLDIDKGDNVMQISISASNNLCSGYLEFYSDCNDFIDFAKKLADFPRINTEKITFEHMKRNMERSNGYFLLEVFCFEPSGHSAIKIIIERYSDTPYYYTSEFFILTEPASINKLGIGLMHWDPLQQGEFVWLAGE